MRIFIYEYVTAGGAWRSSISSPPEGSLLREGAAMANALIEDFAKLKNTQVVVMRDRRLSLFQPSNCRIVDIDNAEHEQAARKKLAAESDYTLLIAPEFDGLLLDCCQSAEQAGAKLLSPDAEFVRIASNKHRTAERLAAAGVATPKAIRLLAADAPPTDFPFPAILKPTDGAGSLGLCYVENRAAEIFKHRPAAEMRLEQLIVGEPISVSILCGPGESSVLPASLQRLSTDGLFQYLGGAAPLSRQKQQRARRLALRALKAMPAATGYVGVDLVLGEQSDGRDDVVIEINPRLTTSYVGLRKVVQNNLAGAMLAVAENRPVELSLNGNRVTFDADGSTRIAQPTPD